ncbi:MAG: recombinase family protein, partial [Chloroflexi bacterium]|nr:recombinase family protein [Chloroflexota bacterium]
MALSGWKLLAIGREFGKRGILTPSGKRDWNTNTLRNILKNRAYSGVYEALKQESIEPCHRRKATYGKTSRRLRPEHERVLLPGLVERPLVTEQEFAWVQQRLRDNQLYAKRNTSIREYVLKGLVRCSACGHTYIGVTRNGHSYYYCGAKRKPVNREACQSRGIRATEVEDGAFQTVVDFLRGPQGFENEIRRRYGLTEENETSLRRQITNLEGEDMKEEEAESRAFRLAAHALVSEQVFQQEIGLIRTRRRWLKEELHRLEQQLADIERHTFSPDAVESLRHRLEERLARATPEDRRFVLESLGAKVIAYPDGTWDMEIELPRQVKSDLQIVHSRPGSLSQKVEHGILCEIQNGWDSGICTKKFADLDGGFQAPSDYYLNFVA